MISTNQFRNGNHIDVDGTIFKIVEFQHVKPGKGGAFVRTKLKKVAGGAVLERTFRADEKVPLAMIDKREMQYLYREGSALVFMDTESYDQLHVDTRDLGSTVEFLKEGDAAVLHMYDGAVVSADVPAAVELTVTNTEPGEPSGGRSLPSSLRGGFIRGSAPVRGSSRPRP